MTDPFEERNFRCLVEFNRDKLIELQNGGTATTIFTSYTHSQLKKYGVIQRVRDRRFTKPTPRAMCRWIGRITQQYGTVAGAHRDLLAEHEGLKRKLTVERQLAARARSVEE